MSPRKKIPTKIELLQLQKLYKTDEKIGERLGGVPAYLIAYWRRKKNIPKYSLPKFSEREILNLWERFGDDEKCGLELGISKAAFYNWRRRYGIKEKPAFLKLEQLELDFPNSKANVVTGSLYGKQDITRKIISPAVGGGKVEVGQTVEIEPDLVMVRNNAGKIINDFRSSGSEFVWNPNKIVIHIDSFTRPSGDPGSRLSHKEVRDFVKRQGIRNFFDIREGNAFQVIIEKGLVMPGQFLVGNDRLTVSLGSLDVLAVFINDEEMSSIWTSGKFPFQVPSTVRVNITGRRTRGVFTRDIALSIVRQLQNSNLSGKVLEYGGPSLSQMSISERFTLSVISQELGVRAAICPYDSTTRRYLTGRIGGNLKPIMPDKDADYHEVYQVSVEQLTPQVSCPDGNIKPVSELEGLPVNQVILGSHTNGRFDDLRVGADILKGKKINPDCRMLVYPVSRKVYLEALKKGLIRVYVEAGAMVMNPASESCLQMHMGGLSTGERCLATFQVPIEQGIMPQAAEVFYVSPATAAASALNAALTDPTRYVK
ncbi:MAG: aconitase family protein [candidate division Zixibacteria bacterium]|nr:aconitase family protein [candidate division Zixibacteria bacterium]MDD5425665.1 aconitase family protein [candidate division Zixibacteria bacterium]